MYFPYLLIISFTWGVNNALLYPLVEIVYYETREKIVY